jgi:hypothetical protein
LGRAAAVLLVVAPTLVVAADTVQDFSANFPPPPPPIPLVINDQAHQQAGSLTGSDGSVSFLRLTDDQNDGAGNIGRAGLGQVLTNVGPYDSLVFDFDFRMNDPGAGADGFSFAYLPVANYGNGGSAPNLGETPNFGGGFGIGFDTWNNDDSDDNDPLRAAGSLPDSLSIHWNGGQLGLSLDMVTANGGAVPTVIEEAWLENNVTKHAKITVVPNAGNPADKDITLLVTEPSTGESVTMTRTAVGMPFYDGRVGFSGRTGGEDQNQDIDNLVTTFTPAGGAPIVTVVNNFDDFTPPPPQPEPTPLGGTPFARRQHGNAPASTIVPSSPPVPPSGGELDGQYQLTHSSEALHNSIAFDKTFGTLGDGHQIIGSFDIKIVNDPGDATADGMSFMLIDTSQYGTTGPLPVGSFFPPGTAEDPNFPGVIGLGFDTFDNDEDFAAGDPTGCPPVPGDPTRCVERRANSISVHNGNQKAQQFLPNVEYNDGNWIRVDFAVNAIDDAGTLLGTMDVAVTDLTTGETFVAFSGEGLGAIPRDLRVAFAARTGNEWDFQFLDNVNIQHIPEPSTWALMGIAGAGLFALRRRRK